VAPAFIMATAARSSLMPVRMINGRLHPFGPEALEEVKTRSGLIRSVVKEDDVVVGFGQLLTRLFAGKDVVHLQAISRRCCCMAPEDLGIFQVVLDEQNLQLLSAPHCFPPS